MASGRLVVMAMTVMMMFMRLAECYEAQSNYAVGNQGKSNMQGPNYKSNLVRNNSGLKYTVMDRNSRSKMHEGFSPQPNLNSRMSKPPSGHHVALTDGFNGHYSQILTEYNNSFLHLPLPMPFVLSIPATDIFENTGKKYIRDNFHAINKGIAAPSNPRTYYLHPTVLVSDFPLQHSYMRLPYFPGAMNRTNGIPYNTRNGRLPANMYNYQRRAPPNFGHASNSPSTQAAHRQPHPYEEYSVKWTTSSISSTPNGKIIVNSTGPPMTFNLSNGGYNYNTQHYEPSHAEDRSDNHHDRLAETSVPTNIEESSTSSGTAIVNPSAPMTSKLGNEYYGYTTPPHAEDHSSGLPMTSKLGNEYYGYTAQPHEPPHAEDQSGNHHDQPAEVSAPTNIEEPSQHAENNQKDSDADNNSNGATEEGDNNHSASGDDGVAETKENEGTQHVEAVQTSTDERPAHTETTQNAGDAEDQADGNVDNTSEEEVNVNSKNGDSGSSAEATTPPEETKLEEADEDSRSSAEATAPEETKLEEADEDSGSPAKVTTPEETKLEETDGEPNKPSAEKTAVDGTETNGAKEESPETGDMDTSIQNGSEETPLYYNGRNPSSKEIPAEVSEAQKLKTAEVLTNSSKESLSRRPSSIANAQPKPLKFVNNKDEESKKISRLQLFNYIAGKGRDEYNRGQFLNRRPLHRADE